MKREAKRENKEKYLEDLDHLTPETSFITIRFMY